MWPWPTCATPGNGQHNPHHFSISAFFFLSFSLLHTHTHTYTHLKPFAFSPVKLRIWVLSESNKTSPIKWPSVSPSPAAPSVLYVHVMYVQCILNVPESIYLSLLYKVFSIDHCFFYIYWFNPMVWMLDGINNRPFTHSLTHRNSGWSFYHEMYSESAGRGFHCFAKWCLSRTHGCF